MQLDFVPQAKCIHFRTSNLYTRTRTACSNFGQLLMSIRLKLRQSRYVVKCDLVLTIETRDGFWKLNGGYKNFQPYFVD